jgi:hypothetical protein
VIHRSTVVVADRLAYHRVRFDAAVRSAHGRKVTTLAGLAARLAGPLQQVADEVAIRRALSQIPVQELDSLASVADLPGFARAAAATLQSAWHSDLDIAGLAQQHGGRWHDIAVLERIVREQLPARVSTPRQIVERALSRVEFAPRITGDVTFDGLDTIPPVYRPLLSELSRQVTVRWLGRSEEPGTPLPEGTQYQAPTAKTPTLSRVACADPHHEVVEALRWARRLLASGAAKPSEIAIAAASQEQYEDAVLALSAEANLPLHSAGGISALADRDGQLAAALADVLIRGIDRHRVRRLVSLGRSSRRGARLAALPDHWLQALPEDAPLTTPERWARGLASKGDELDAVREVLRDLGADLAGGKSAAAEVGERWLRGRARQLWRRALDEGPAQAIDVSLARLRVDDGVDPAASIVWASASALAGSPRPFVRLLGLASRSWPRRRGEDPLLPDHVLGGVVLHEQSLAEQDRRSFRTILHRVGSEVVLSRAKRDAEGRRLAPSPLLRQVDAGDEVELLPRRLPEHAFSEADRRLARPDELATDTYALGALSTWRAWFSERLTPHDGLVRADHPAVVRALERVHSATSLKALLRNPIGFVWSYALGWRTPSDLVEALTLDALERGELLHLVLDSMVTELEVGPGLPSASETDIAAAADRAVSSVAEAWAIERPVPPEVLWSAVLTETRDLAVVALTLPLSPLDGQRSYVELPFGDVRAEELTLDVPWDPRVEVRVGESDLRIQGRIDRLDLSADGRNARVVDYKSSRKTGEPAERAVDIDEGKELQRCLYGYAVRHLLGQDTEVEATLVYPATRRSLPIRDAEGTLRGLELAVSAAAQRLREGYAVLGPDTLEDWFESKLALPADLRRGYYTRKLEELERAREPIDAILKAGPGELREELA